MNELHLFAGAGGGILAGQLLGHRCVCAVERDTYAQAVLLARQNDGTFPPFPIWDDVTTFDGTPWRGLVDVVAGGFPCQDISAAGTGKGLDGERSGLWREMARIIGEVQPRFVFIENSPLLIKRGFEVVLKDLAEMGFDAAWGVLGAAFAGFDHRRERVWVVANRTGNRLERGDNQSEKRQREAAIGSMARLRQIAVRHDIPAPDTFGAANGVAYRVDRLKTVGNGQVPQVAAAAFQILSAR